MQRNQVQTLSDLFLYATKNSKQPLFSYFNDEQLVEVTSAQFKKDVMAMVGTIGTLSDDRIALLGENSYRYLVAFFAIVIAKKVPVMLDKGLDYKTLKQVVQIAEAGCILYSDQYRAIAGLFDMECYCFDDMDLEKTSESKTTVNATQEDIAVIFHTSSSTGFPKVVPLTHKNIVAELQSLDACTQLSGTALFCLPAYHVYGMIANILYFLYLGIKTFISASPRRLLNELKRVRPTLLSIVPMMYGMILRAMKEEQSVEMLHKVCGGNLKTICFGGAAFTIDATLILNAGIQIYIGYGLTETASSITMRIISASSNEPDNVGKPMPGVEIKIGENNELLVKGDMVCDGYMNKDEKYQSAFEQGWFKTGDCGYIGNKGEVHITGRIKNLIILPNGENVPAEKLEALLYQLAYINECIVKEQDGRIAAFIYCQQTDYAREHIKDDLAKINATLPISHNIAAIEFRDTPFEKTSSQKIKRI